MITAQPQDQTVVAGAGVALTVGAQGTGSLSYQWCFGGAPLATETNDALLISRALRVHSGAYSVRVSDQSGTTTSREAQLRVLVPPRLETPSLLSDGTLRLQFRDSDGALPAELANVTVQWRTNLPSGADTNWETLNSGFFLTNGFIVIQDTNDLSAGSRFYRVIER